MSTLNTKSRGSPNQIEEFLLWVNDINLLASLSLAVYVIYLILCFILVSSRTYGLASLTFGRLTVLVPPPFLQFPASDCYFPFFRVYFFIRVFGCKCFELLRTSLASLIKILALTKGLLRWSRIASSLGRKLLLEILNIKKSLREIGEYKLLVFLYLLYNPDRHFCCDFLQKIPCQYTTAVMELMWGVQNFMEGCLERNHSWLERTASRWV